MHFEQFIDWSPRRETKELIDNALIAYQGRAAYSPTLRSIYYDLIGDLLLENTAQGYARLKRTLTKARDAGMFPWDALIDENRTYNDGWRHNDTTEDLISGLDLWLDIWEGQENYVEVWVEKAAQAGTVQSACHPFRAHWMACKGNLSATFAYNAGKRFAQAQSQGLTPHLIHLGDHDPSGLDMTRDNADRIIKYGNMYWDDLNVHRIALNMDPVSYTHLTLPTKA